MKKILFLLLVAGMAVSKTMAQAPDPDTTARHFLIMASIGDLQEINAGKLAGQKADHADVKAFGQMMVMDHSKAQGELLQLARSQKMVLPDAATITPPFDLNLSKASGDRFDSMYIHAMSSGHRSTVQMFQTYAITGKNPAVKAWAQQMLPTLKIHLQQIEVLENKYKDLLSK